jgi:hypothetical protein
MNDTVAPKTLYLFTSALTPIYFIFCVLGTLVLLPVSLFGFGVSVASDVVFGVLVMIGAPLGDFIFRRVFKASMAILPQLRWQLIHVWPFIGLFIALFRPFE